MSHSSAQPGAPGASTRNTRLRALARSQPVATLSEIDAAEVARTPTGLYFEGDTHSSFHLVRAIKNRFGAVNEIGVSR